jgi:superfamily I DNA and RNA helicase
MYDKARILETLIGFTEHNLSIQDHVGHYLGYTRIIRECLMALRGELLKVSVRSKAEVHQIPQKSAIATLIKQLENSKREFFELDEEDKEQLQS